MLMLNQDNSVLVTDADVQAVKMAIATIKAKLLFLVRVADEEHHRGMKANSRRLGASHSLLATSPGVAGRLPDHFAAAELAMEEDLISVLIEFVSMAEELVFEVDQVRLTSGWKAEDETSLMQAAQQLAQEALQGDNVSSKDVEKIPPPTNWHRDENN